MRGKRARSTSEEGSTSDEGGTSAAAAPPAARPRRSTGGGGAAPPPARRAAAAALLPLADSDSEEDEWGGGGFGGGAASDAGGAAAEGTDAVDLSQFSQAFRAWYVDAKKRRERALARAKKGIEAAVRLGGYVGDDEKDEVDSVDAVVRPRGRPSGGGGGNRTQLRALCVRGPFLFGHISAGGHIDPFSPPETSFGMEGLRRGWELLKAGVKHLTASTFRSSAYTIAQELQLPTEDIDIIARWRDPQMRAQYVRFLRSTLDAALRRKHGLPALSTLDLERERFADPAPFFYKRIDLGRLLEERRYVLDYSREYRAAELICLGAFGTLPPPAGTARLVDMLKYIITGLKGCAARGLLEPPSSTAAMVARGAVAGSVGLAVPGVAAAAAAVVGGAAAAGAGGAFALGGIGAGLVGGVLGATGAFLPGLAASSFGGAVSTIGVLAGYGAGATLSAAGGLAVFGGSAAAAAAAGALVPHLSRFVFSRAFP